MIVSEETNEFVDSDMSDNDDLIADNNHPTRQKWAAKTIHAAGELAGNPRWLNQTHRHMKMQHMIQDGKKP